MKIIKLSRGYVAKVDNDDYTLLSKRHWHVIKTKINKVYAMTSTFDRIYMHRLIMKVSRGMTVDHINGDTLDNRKANLRVCSYSQNAMNQKIGRLNTSGYKGVFYSKRVFSPREWTARIGVNSRKIHIGKYTTKEEAAKAYNKKAIELHGQFARLNIIITNPSPN